MTTLVPVTSLLAKDTFNILLLDPGDFKALRSGEDFMVVDRPVLIFWDFALITMLGFFDTSWDFMLVTALGVLMVVDRGSVPGLVTCVHGGRS